jgi:hypothetical protein
MDGTSGQSHFKGRLVVIAKRTIRSTTHLGVGLGARRRAHVRAPPFHSPCPELARASMSVLDRWVFIPMAGSGKGSDRGSLRREGEASSLIGPPHATKIKRQMARCLCQVRQADLPTYSIYAGPESQARSNTSPSAPCALWNLVCSYGGVWWWCTAVSVPPPLSPSDPVARGSRPGQSRPEFFGVNKGPAPC